METAISEESLLREEADDARVALQRALLGMKDSFISTGDPKLWAKTHPWIAVGVAAAAGFAAASALVPAPGGRTTDKWKGAMNRFASHHTGAPSDSTNPVSKASAVNSPSIWSSVIEALFELAKIAVTNLLASTAHAKATTADICDNENDSSREQVPGTDGPPPQHVG